ncbi:hypothetical protein [Serratia liquefaciens]|uniref:hypothetical protein n=1 Tax=Serratia liquefaciens TaxID=614 RepID=UPI00165D045D|nr:hypothetical protein [Serratia liquefaciens]QNQ56153.1 hypothetical protein IAI46_09380 [Serratia liquefaciens]
MKNNLENQDIKTDKLDFSIRNNSEAWLTIPADGGQITFTGNADDAAKEFFNARIRERDGYISALKAERDASLNAERAWETSMMAVCGEDGPASVAAVIKALAVENAALKSRSIKLFNLGYLRGHESTVEGYFVDVHWSDIDTYHDDVVAEIIEDEDETPATDAALAALQAQGVEKLIKLKMEQLANMHPDTHAFGATAEDMRTQITWLQAFAIELREAK